jgi:orotidine-5'-phosphate decarboxylase
MIKEALIGNIRRKSSFLCVGLDTYAGDLDFWNTGEKIEWRKVLDFNKKIIDATGEFAVSYKLNAAFYEVLGETGWRAMEETLLYLGKDFFNIADAKRGDIGNTSSYYARSFFEKMDFDAVTVAPYMGADSVQPFLAFENKWTILLALTSNAGSRDFQYLKTENGGFLYEEVLKTSLKWGATSDKAMFVVGATQASHLEQIRKIVPEHFLLVPGVGAQGGDLAAVAQYGMTKDCGLLVNMSRGIIFAEKSENFSSAARQAAEKTRNEMAELLNKYA